MPEPTFRLMLVTSTEVVPRARLVAAVRAAVRGGVDAVQIREKDMEGRPLLRLAMELKDAVAGKAALLVNGRVDVALAARTDGVHLPSNGIPPVQARKLLGRDVCIGLSAHAADDVAYAEGQGADYVLLSPVFDPVSKKVEHPSLGVGRFAALAKKTFLPTFALGGITARRTAALATSGAAGVACIGGVLGADDPEAAARAVMERLDAWG